VSTLESGGVPSMVERTLIRPPASRLGPISESERSSLIAASPVGLKYDNALDRESAYEVLKKRAAKTAEVEDVPEEDEDEEEERSDRRKTSSRRTSSRRRSSRREQESEASGGLLGEILGGGGRRQSVAEAAVKSVVRSVGSSLGRALVRGILGSLKR